MTESTLTRRHAAALALGAPLILGTSPGLARAAPIVSQTPEAPEAVDGEAATFAETGGDTLSHITAEVMVNGQGPFNFLVDTGANRSAVSERLVERLGLPLGPPMRVLTVVGSRERPTVELDELRIGDRAQRDVRAPVLLITGDHFDGVLGVDWLRGRRLTFFFDESRLEITGSNAIIANDGREVKRNPVIVPARLKQGQLTIIDAQMGRRLVTTMIDTGAQLTLGNQVLYRMAVNQPGAERGDKPVAISTVTGERRYGEVIWLPSLRVGGVMFRQVPVVFADLPMFATWGLEDEPGIVLGLDLISQFSAVMLDFGRRQVRFAIGGSGARGSRQADRRSLGAGARRAL